jgi:hypothetical protein
MTNKHSRSDLLRRTFLKTAAGVSAGTLLMREQLWAQGAAAGKATALPKIHQPFVLTPKQALDWNMFKAECGPTYAGSTGWKRYTDFLISTTTTSSRTGRIAGRTCRARRTRSRN